MWLAREATNMKIHRLFITITLAIGLTTGAQLFAKEKSKSSGGTDAAFIKKAANGGITEVELGRIAAEKGTSQDVKDFGNRMVTDHGKANDQLKTVASKLNHT
jgi:putative membrane protein